MPRLLEQRHDLFEDVVSDFVVSIGIRISASRTINYAATR